MYNVFHIYCNYCFHVTSTHTLQFWLNIHPRICSIDNYYCFKYVYVFCINFIFSLSHFYSSFVIFFDYGLEPISIPVLILPYIYMYMHRLLGCSIFLCIDHGCLQLRNSLVVFTESEESYNVLAITLTQKNVVFLIIQSKCVWKYLLSTYL